MKEIQIENFSIKKGSFQLQPVNLSIKSGEIFSILGRTGSGKTVLLESIAGMYRGDAGRILFDGVDVCDIPPGQRHIGLVYQDYSLFPHMKVWENIAYGLKMHGCSRQEQKSKADELMEMMSISHIKNQYPGTLSGGEKQRTALARALALKPETLLMDEPFSALDPAMRSGLYDTLLEIHKKFGCTIIFVTHDFNEAKLLSDTIAVLLNGRIMAVSPAESFFSARYCDEVEEFLGRRLK